MSRPQDMETFALHSTRVITPNGVIEATLVISDGKTKEVLYGKVQQDNIPFETVGDKVIMRSSR